MDLIGAILAKNYKKAKELLLNNFNPNAVDDWMNVTPLHYAVLKEAPEFILKLLVTAGANVLAETGDGYTPLDLAIIYNRQNIIKFLKHLVASGITAYNVPSNIQAFH